MDTSETHHSTLAPVSASPSTTPYKTYSEIETICAEYMKPFTTRNRKKLFCSKEHKTAFHNRCKARGQVLVPLAMAWRGSSDTAKTAMSQMCNALDAWRSEDRTGVRMPMEDFVGRGFERDRCKVFCRGRRLPSPAGAL